MLKIHYQINEQDGGDEGTITGVISSKKGKGSAGGRVEGAAEEGLLGGLSGLRVGRKEIVTKDWKVMRRVYTAIQNYSRRSTLL